MKQLVCISKTPDTTSKIAFENSNTKFSEDGIQFIMNPYDEWYALVKAVEIKEALGGTVTVINVGPASNDVVIRKALAIGADDAIRVDAEEKSAMYVAKQIAEHAKDFDIVFTGKETINYNGAEVGGMIAEYLDLPYISFASHMDIDGNEATITRDIEGGTEIAKVSTPFVVSAAKGMAEQRIPNMRGIMMAKRKPLNVVPATDANEGVVISSFDLPSGKSAVKMIDPENMDELVRLLKEEAKVI